MIDSGFEQLMRGSYERNTTRPCEAATGAQMEASKGFDEWALVELMGHQRIAGRVTEAEIGGCKFIRVDVPEQKDEPALTKFLGQSSIYGITPMSEETCRDLASRISTAPVSVWDARRLIEIKDKNKPAELRGSVRNDPFSQEDLDEEEDEEDGLLRA